MKNKALLLALATTVFALSSQAQTTFGVRAGVNFQNINGEDVDGEDLDYKLKTGINVGVNAEIPVAPDFYVQPGVLFSTKGAKSKVDDDSKIKLSYIEVPINFLYKPTLGTGKLLLGIGPYVAFAVGGKVSDANGDDEDIEFENEITLTQFGSGTPYARRLDVGGNLLFGYEFSNKFSAQLNAQLGMVKINPEITGPGVDDDSKVKNTGFGISLGYRF
ncbi:PorT family protein [Niastella caeni]|uniref:PorT family protein n=1 Tax=Niastella caeni TaxID=2569763 RepID=A0A4S8I2M2_9BACT|nr:porin family protein [Niastella caeni]THU40924.1 PorT family protein [Niastella caeni]